MYKYLVLKRHGARSTIDDGALDGAISSSFTYSNTHITVSSVRECYV
jgi:hypothetical protein